MIIKTCIRNSKKRSDGTYAIYYFFADKGKTAYLSSNVFISNPKKLKNGQIVNEPNTMYNTSKVNQQLIDFQKAYDALPEWQKSMEVNGIVKIIQNSKFKNDVLFSDFAHEVINDYKNAGKNSYETKEYALSKFKNKFANITITGINRNVLNEFIGDMAKSGLSNTTVSMCVREIRTIYYKAQEAGIVSRDVDPFFKFKIPKWNSRDVALDIEQLKSIRDVILEDKMQEVSRDVFMAIFYLRGINFVDLVHLNKPIDNRIIYNRRKTSETKSNDIPISLKIQPELEELLLKYKGEEFAFDFGYKFIDYRDFRRLINRWIKKVAEKSNININLTTYVARHSWATIADELGIDTNVIEYVLGQSSKGRIVFQYTHRRHKAADEAIRTVLDELK